MASTSEKLADSLEALKKLQELNIGAIQAKDLSRTHRERLLRSGFLREIIKGWYMFCQPDETEGESTAWYTSYWQFCSAYLEKRFGKKWCLSSEQSLSLHAENWTVPKQLLVRAPKGNNNIILLPHQTSLVDIRSDIPDQKIIFKKNNLNIFSLPTALVTCSPNFYIHNPTDMRTALALIQDASQILEVLLKGGNSTVAGRLTGAFRNIGRNKIADEILKTMFAADYNVREINPFKVDPIVISSREKSPYVNRMNILWHEMRESIINHFPKPPKRLLSSKAYLSCMEKTYVADAYHSLSIEGYKVNADLIERVRFGGWNPEHNANDRTQASALAARGYWQAFKAVETSIRKVLKRSNPGKIVSDDHRDWYREMFAPCVQAGLLKPVDLAGYRNGPVYIRGSMHIPPNPEAVRDLMPAFFELLEQEKEPAVRIVLGHFFFVFIHPYMDGNGRIGRFLMNVMLAAGGYPWIIIPVEQRTQYMTSLEEASVRQNIKMFTKFLAKLVQNRLEK